MKRRVFIRSSWGLAGLAGLAAVDGGTALCWSRRSLIGFGTTLSVQAAHRDPVALELALDAGVAVIRSVEAAMNLFDPGSALSRLNREGVLSNPPAELRAVLSVARAVSERSDGAFDATVQPLWTLFDNASRAGALPSAREVAAARALVDWRGIEVTDARIRLAESGMGVTLNGIAQGHASDRVRAVLQAHGVQHALIDTGEFATLGRNPLGRRWALGIADPHEEGALIARLLADGRCIATSGDDQTVFSADHRHHHIFDPHTGYSPTELSGVTVLAERGALADALTKVIFVAGPQKALRLAAAWGVDVLVVDKAGRWRASPGLTIEPA